MNPVKTLQEHGQAVWLDFLARGFIANGDLKKLVDEAVSTASPRTPRSSRKRSTARTNTTMR